MDITKLNNAIEQDNQAKLKKEQEKLAKRQKAQQDVTKLLGIIDEDIIQEKAKEYINSIKNCSDDVLQALLEEYLVSNADLRNEDKLTLKFINSSKSYKKVSILQKANYEQAYKDYIDEIYHSDIEVDEMCTDEELRKWEADVDELERIYDEKAEQLGCEKLIHFGQ
jgi:hypothetical protein